MFWCRREDYRTFLTTSKTLFHCGVLEASFCARPRSTNLHPSGSEILAQEQFKKPSLRMASQIGAVERTWTSTGLLLLRPERSASTIPPLRHIFYLVQVYFIGLGHVPRPRNFIFEKQVFKRRFPCTMPPALLTSTGLLLLRPATHTRLPFRHYGTINLLILSYNQLLIKITFYSPVRGETSRFWVGWFRGSSSYRHCWDGRRRYSWLLGWSWRVGREQHRGIVVDRVTLQVHR